MRRLSLTNNKSQAVDKCLNLLQELRGNIENRGFEENSDKAILTHSTVILSGTSEVERCFLISIQFV